MSKEISFDSLYYCSGGRYTRDTIISPLRPRGSTSTEIMGRVERVLPSQARTGDVKVGQEWDVKISWLSPCDDMNDPNFAFRIYKGRVAK